MRIYAVALRRWVNIPEKDLKKVVKNGTIMLQGTYKDAKKGKVKVSKIIGRK